MTAFRASRSRKGSRLRYNSSMKMRVLGLLALMALLPGAAMAQGRQDARQKDAEIHTLPGGGDDFAFQRTFDDRTEPQIPEVKFLAQDPPRTLKERTDRLLEGIMVDVPPEYDHYGYEMRRYMAHILNREVFSNRERLKQELQNIRNARIVLDYWGKALNAEIEAIETEIEQSDASSTMRTTFNYNRGVASAFLQEAGAWLEHNENLLAFLLGKNPAEYGINGSELIFMSPEDSRAFGKLLKIREAARKIVAQYAPFRVMPY